MIERISNLNTGLLWLIFLLCALAMAIVPFYSKLKKALRIKFSNQKPEIKDFSWRFAPDHFLFNWKGKSYYLQSNGKQFIVEGGTIIISWEVAGAYQIDIKGIGTDLKGNTAATRASKTNYTYELMAHTLNGKLTRSLSLDPALFKNIGTLNLSKEKSFNQETDELKTEKLTELKWMHDRYSKDKVSKMPTIQVSKAWPKIKVYFYNGILKKKRLKNPLSLEKNRIINYISQNKVVKTYVFNPHKYNDALNTHKTKD